MVGQRLYSQNFLVMETMAAVAFYYVLIVTVFDFLLKRLESYLDVTRRKVTRPIDSEMQRLATQTRPAIVRSAVDNRSRRCRRQNCTKPITTWKCSGPSACKFSRERWSR
jgi:hypothetical protein